MHTCEVCNAKVGELRRGRCWGCYARWVDARPVGIGARCIACGEKRRRLMKTVELHASWHPMCFNCAGQLLHLDPVPPTIAALREAVSRERRRTDRRAGKADTRVFRYERRVGDRRAVGQGYDRVDDDMVVEVVIEELEVRDTGDLEIEDVTRIRDLVMLEELGEILELDERRRKS